jgi:hypothetical protein
MPVGEDNGTMVRKTAEKERGKRHPRQDTKTMMEGNRSSSGVGAKYKKG